MNGKDFSEIIESVYLPFFKKMGFGPPDTLISGKYYRTNFKSKKFSVLISFEPEDSSLFVMVFNIENGVESDIDDRKNTPRLSELNASYMGAVNIKERLFVDEFFKKIIPKDAEEKNLIKSAKELFLVLPKYMNEKSNKA